MLFSHSWFYSCGSSLGTGSVWSSSEALEADREDADDDKESPEDSIFQDREDNNQNVASNKISNTNVPTITRTRPTIKLIGRQRPQIRMPSPRFKRSTSMIPPPTSSAEVIFRPQNPMGTPAATIKRYPPPYRRSLSLRLQAVQYQNDQLIHPSKHSSVNNNLIGFYKVHTYLLPR